MLKNQIVEIDGQRWKIREARSLDDAQAAIVYARCDGSVGSTIIEESRMVGGTRKVIADVVRINSDDTECKPYTEIY